MTRSELEQLQAKTRKELKRLEDNLAQVKTYGTDEMIQKAQQQLDYFNVAPLIPSWEKLYLTEEGKK